MRFFQYASKPENRTLVLYAIAAALFLLVCAIAMAGTLLLTRKGRGGPKADETREPANRDENAPPPSGSEPERNMVEYNSCMKTNMEGGVAVGEG